MNYKYYETDKNGFVHSIDNLHITYDLKAIEYNLIKNKIIPKLQETKNKYKTANYYERLDINANRRYYFCRDFFHVDDGIMLYCGYQTEKIDKPLKSGEKYFTLPRIRLEFNPNKHADSDILKYILDVITEHVEDAQIVKYDYAVDLPYEPKDVQVFSSLKEKGLYKGTRYYGQRGQNGFTRIYDKAKEQNLSTPLTRVETVCKLSKKSVVSFEKVYYKKNTQSTNQLKGTDKAIVELCLLCNSYGADYNDALSFLDRRKKKTILENLQSAEYVLLEYDEALRDRLLKRVCEDYCVSMYDEPIKVDDNGFCIIPDDMNLPFDI